MKTVAEYITEKDEQIWCSDCCEICSRHCPIWRKAEFAYDKHERKEGRYEKN